MCDVESPAGLPSLDSKKSSHTIALDMLVIATALKGTSLCLLRHHSKIADPRCVKVRPNGNW
jgi:hypothetical protein